MAQNSTGNQVQAYLWKIWVIFIWGDSFYNHWSISVVYCFKDVVLVEVVCSGITLIGTYNDTLIWLEYWWGWFILCRRWVCLVETWDILGVACLGVFCHEGVRNVWYWVYNLMLLRRSCTHVFCWRFQVFFGYVGWCIV